MTLVVSKITSDAIAVHVQFDHKGFLWRPHHAGTSRQFECTRLITAEAVKATIRRIPGFGVGNADAGKAVTAV